ncbi:MAG: MlaD family protein [Planctomycetota bacterium]|jgi:ABC-type transporter Mla subunit MlaD
MNRKHNNVAAGVFVLVGLALGFGVVVVLTDFSQMFEEKQTVAVRFPISDGLKGLGAGATVTIGNHPAGEVVSIEDAADGPAAKKVTFTISAKYTLYDDAVIELDVPAIGSDTKLNIRDFGSTHEGETSPRGLTRQGARWEHETGETLHGGVAPSMLASEFVDRLGIEDAQRAQIKKIIADIQTITTAASAEPEAITQIVTNVRDVTATVKQRLPAIADNIEVTAANARQMTDQAKDVVADFRERYEIWRNGIDEVVGKARLALDSANAILDENRAAFKDTVDSAKSTMANAEAVSQTVRTEWLTSVRDALAKANESLENVRSTTDDFKSLTATQKPVIEGMLANLRLTGDQLKLAAVEVRRSPWRLLYQPADKEFETEDIYNAARSFSLASSELNTAAQSLQSVMDRYSDALDTDDANIQLILQRLKDTFDRYENAQDKFWEALDESPINE